MKAPPRLLALLGTLLLAGPAAGGSEPSSGWARARLGLAPGHPQGGPGPQEGAPEGQAQEGSPQAPPPAYRHSLELAFGAEFFQVGYRELSGREDGYWGVEALVNEDSDWAVNARLARLGQLGSLPLRAGVGVAAYAAVFDETDSDAYALPLVGILQWDLPTAVPTTASVEVAFAPDVVTFADGDELVDLALRIEAILGERASAFAGYRVLDVDTDIDDELVQGLAIGIRLGL